MPSKSQRTNDRSKGKNRPPIVKSGLYDGTESSENFLVTGHSTGAANTEMEAMSHQVSIDAGRVPDYPVERYRSRAQIEADVNEFDRDLSMNEDDDLDFSGGPGLYGPKPNLLKTSRLSGAEEKLSFWARPIWKVAMWSGVGLAAAAGIGAISYGIYRATKTAQPE